MIRKLLFLFGLFFATAAQAEWREAESENFLVYSQANEAELRAFTAKLEQFDYVLRTFHKVTDPPSPNKLRVFLLPGLGDVGRLAGSSGVAGFYVQDARGLMMVGTQESGGKRLLSSEEILLHEYTHHFMYHYFPATYPAWYSEGFAEFWGATRFNDKGVVEIGHPAEHRFGSFQANRWLPIKRLLTAQNYADIGGYDLDLLYAQGWLLVRYIFDNPERKQQLDRYLALINAGRSYEEAMNEAFGSGGGSLNDALFNYAGKARFDVVQLPFRQLPVGAIQVRTLRPAEDALIEHEMKLSMGVQKREMGGQADEIRSVAERFPTDPFALALLAEAEYLAENNEAATAAVERLLAVDPENVRGLLVSGRMQVEALKTAGSTDAAAWEQARKTIIRANRLATDDPLPLEAYYDSYTAQGVLPPEHAQAALYAAHELAPSDPDLRYKLALDFEQRDMIPEAIAIIRPDAYRTPDHSDESERERARRERAQEKYRRAGTERRETAREMLVRLEEKRSGATADAGGK